MGKDQGLGLAESMRRSVRIYGDDQPGRRRKSDGASRSGMGNMYMDMDVERDMLEVKEERERESFTKANDRVTIEQTGGNGLWTEEDMFKLAGWLKKVLY